MQVQSLSHIYGTKTVLDHLDFSIVERSICVVTGSNGSGKTTLLKILSTLIEPQSGEIRVHGMDARTQAKTVRALLSCALVNTRGLFPNLSVKENLNFHGRLFGMGNTEIETALADLSPLIGDKLSYRPEALSTGMRQAVLLAKALMRPVPLYLLDEPYLALDKERIDELNRILRARAERGATIVLSAQNAHLSWIPKIDIKLEIDARGMA
ncbi:MAG: ATP-binding cassette domain-containing protein [Bdellovibrionales bacterium]